MIDRPLKILMIAPTPYFSDRGCHVRIYEEARTLVQMGSEVRIVTYHLGRDTDGIPVDRTVAVPWYRKISAGPSWHKPYLDILVFLKALSVARSFRPDMIHAHLHEGAFIGIFLKKLLGVPLLFDCQGSLTLEVIDHGFIRNGSLLSRIFRYIEQFINNRADRIIASSTPGARSLTGEWGIPEEKVFPLTDGVNAEEFRPLNRDAARVALKLPPGIPVVVFLGVMNRYQGVDLLLDVIKIIQERGTPAHFLLMGFPDGRYRQLAGEMGISEMITFTGRIDYKDAPFFLSAADISVSPKISLTEANGKLFNYLACALPVLAFDTPVNREILGECGLFARYPETADFADRLHHLLSDPLQRKELAARGREIALSRYSWRSKGEQLDVLYREMLRR